MVVMITALQLPSLPWLDTSRSTPAAAVRARRALLTQLRTPKPDRVRLDAAAVELVQAAQAGGAPFDEQVIGGGPWRVVHTKGALPWQAWTSAGERNKVRCGSGGRRGGRSALLHPLRPPPPHPAGLAGV